jgi:hypothetical protein
LAPWSASEDVPDDSRRNRHCNAARRSLLQRSQRSIACGHLYFQIGNRHHNDRSIDQWNGRDIGPTPRSYDATQDGTQFEKRKEPSKYDDITLPAPACEGPSRGFTIAHLPVMKEYKFKWVGDGDEYYVMYSDNNPSLKLV